MAGRHEGSRGTVVVTAGRKGSLCAVAGHLAGEGESEGGGGSRAAAGSHFDFVDSRCSPARRPLCARLTMPAARTPLPRRPRQAAPRCNHAYSSIVPAGPAQRTRGRCWLAWLPPIVEQRARGPSHPHACLNFDRCAARSSRRGPALCPTPPPPPPRPHHPHSPDSSSFSGTSGADALYARPPGQDNPGFLYAINPAPRTITAATPTDIGTTARRSLHPRQPPSSPPPPSSSSV